MNIKTKNLYKDFILFSTKKLKIGKIPIIRLHKTRRLLKTTANYDYTQETKIINIYIKNRAFVDICRSIAHELVHHKQYENKELLVKPRDVGGKIENEANAKAGILIKLYAKKEPNLYDL